MCLTRFCTNGNLRVHMRTHSREVPSLAENVSSETSSNENKQKQLDDIIAEVEADSPNLIESNQLVPNLQVLIDNDLMNMHIENVESNLDASLDQAQVMISFTPANENQNNEESQNNSDENQNNKSESIKFNKKYVNSFYIT